MRYVSRALLAGGLGLAAAFLTACGGGSNVLDASQNSSLSALLSQAHQDNANGDCAGADAAIGKLQQQIANLPGSVDPTLVSDLGRGASTAATLARRQCGGSVAPGPQTTTTPKTPTTSRTTSTPTTTSTTTTPTTTTTTTSPTTTTPTTTSTPATTTPTPGTTSTGTNGGAGLPGAGTGGAGSGGAGNGDGQGNGPATEHPSSDE